MRVHYGLRGLFESDKELQITIWQNELTGKFRPNKCSKINLMTKIEDEESITFNFRFWEAIPNFSLHSEHFNFSILAALLCFFYDIWWKLRRNFQILHLILRSIYCFVLYNPCIFLRILFQGWHMLHSG